MIKVCMFTSSVKSARQKSNFRKMLKGKGDKYDTYHTIASETSSKDVGNLISFTSISVTTVGFIFTHFKKFILLVWPLRPLAYSQNYKVLGLVVQSVVSLTSSLRVISLTVLADSIFWYFFAEKMWVKLLTFFQQKNSAHLRITRCKF